MKQQPTKLGRRRRNFYLPDNLMEQVEVIAGMRATTATDVVRKALEAYIRAWKAKNHG